MDGKSALAVYLTCAMAMAALPVVQFNGVEAADGNFGGGTGTLNDPFIIEDVRDLQNMNNSLSACYTWRHK